MTHAALPLRYLCRLLTQNKRPGLLSGAPVGVAVAAVAAALAVLLARRVALALALPPVPVLALLALASLITMLGYS